MATYSTLLLALRKRLLDVIHGVGYARGETKTEVIAEIRKRVISLL